MDEERSRQTGRLMERKVKDIQSQINKHLSKVWRKKGADRKEDEWIEEVKIDRVTLETYV